MPTGELFENVLLGRTWMAATKCKINRATNEVTMVTPSCPTGSHCTHCSLQKLTLLKGLSELASPKPNPKLTPNALTTNPLHTTKSAPTNSASIIWQPRQQSTLRWVPKAKPQRRKKPRRKNYQRFLNLQAAGFPRNSFGRKAIIQGFLTFGSQKLSCQIPNQKQSKRQWCDAGYRQKLQANGCPQVILWHKSIVLATRR